MNAPRTTAGTHTPPGTDPLNSDRSASELHDDIRQTRASLDRKLGQLGDRLHPKAVFGDFFDAFKGDGSGGQLTRTLVNNIKRNPVPAAMVGAGLAWLLLSDSETTGPGRRAYDRIAGSFGGDADEERPGRAFESSRRQDRRPWVASDPLTDAQLDEIDAVYPEYRPYQRLEVEVVRLDPLDDSDEANEKRSRWAAARDKAAAAASAAGEKAAGMGQSIADGVKRAAARVSDAASAAAEGVRSGASATAAGLSSVGSGVSSAASSAGDAVASAASTTRDAAARGVEWTKDTADEYPVSTGLAALAAGMIAGLVIPRTAHEDEAFGAAADEVKSAVKSAAVDAADRAKSVASTTASAAVERGKELGLAAEELKAKSQRIADAARRAAEEAAREEGLAPDQLQEKAQEIGQHTADTAKQEAAKHVEQSEAKRQVEKVG